MSQNWSYLKYRRHELLRRAVRLVSSRLYRDTNGDTRRTIVIAGAGRSGTTWLGSTIGSQCSARLMFEPFHSRKVRQFSQFNYFQYMRPAQPDEELREYCQRVFTGKIRDRWIDRRMERTRPRHRLVKEIRANLFLKWIHLRFPEIPLLFIVRHPCAVVASRMQLDWATDGDIEPFLAQPQLVEDFLADKLDVIRNAETDEEKHAVVWCISNLVPLRQFDPGELNLFFYEDLVRQPRVEIPRLFRVIQLPYQDSVFAQAERPSTTTLRSSAIVTGDDKVSGWQKRLSAAQVARILRVVEAFELDHVYGEGPLPTTSVPDGVG